MKRLFITGVAALTTLALVGPAQPALAANDTFGAIAYAPASGVWGEAYGVDSAGFAEK
jgi:hypothetical protein